MDKFAVYIGICFALPPNTDVEPLETGTDPRLRAAKKWKLKSWWGQLTDGGYYFLLIGAEVGMFGPGASFAKSMPLQELVRVGDDVRERLRAAGFDEEPALHCQMEAEY